MGSDVEGLSPSAGKPRKDRLYFRLARDVVPDRMVPHPVFGKTHTVCPG